MENVGIGDVIFIILILGVIHGIMQLIALARARKRQGQQGLADKE